MFIESVFYRLPILPRDIKDCIYCEESKPFAFAGMNYYDFGILFTSLFVLKRLVIRVPLHDPSGPVILLPLNRKPSRFPTCVMRLQTGTEATGIFSLFAIELLLV